MKLWGKVHRLTLFPLVFFPKSFILCGNYVEIIIHAYCSLFPSIVIFPCMHVYRDTGNMGTLGADVVGTGNLRAFFPCIHVWELFLSWANRKRWTKGITREIQRYASKFECSCGQNIKAMHIVVDSEVERKSYSCPKSKMIFPRPQIKANQLNG